MGDSNLGWQSLLTDTRNESLVVYGATFVVAPFDHCFSFSECSDINTAASVASLFHSVCEFAIARSVSALIVNSFNHESIFVPVRNRPSAKHLEIAPLSANVNASPAVALVVFVAGIIAASPHSAPDSIQARSTTWVGNSVFTAPAVVVALHSTEFPVFDLAGESMNNSRAFAILTYFCGHHLPHPSVFVELGKRRPEGDEAFAFGSIHEVKPIPAWDYTSVGRAA